jgi:hypothetical protein
MMTNPRNVMRKILLMMAAVGMLSEGVLTSSRLIAQEATTESNSEAVDLVRQSWANQTSVTACDQCHYQPRGGIARADTSFSRQDELRFWLENDKHAIARRRVEPLNIDELSEASEKLRDTLKAQRLPADWFGASNALSRRICDKLGFDVTQPEGYAKFRDACLTCHGGYQGEQYNVHFAKDDQAQPGISCNYCHQIDGKEDWIDVHGGINAATTWRNRTPEEKAALGMRDLVNVGVQAATCYDCHIGNREKNMFVTHVMYAAGHPPLPGIELQTFCESMPQHWQKESDLYKSLEAASFGGLDGYFLINYPTLFEDDRILKLSPQQTYWNTRKIISGAVAARVHTLDLLVQSATPEHWADYSLYDCAACHHELREPSGRQLRGYEGAPGRPRQAEWSQALLDVALVVAGQDRAEIESLEAKLAAAFAQTPFGDPALIQPIANELKDKWAATLEVVQNRSYRGVSAREIIRQLALTPEDQLLVYDSARQIVWAIQSIAKELQENGEPLPDELSTLIRSLGDASVTGIDSTLPAGRQVFIYPTNLNEDLQRKASFDPRELSKHLQTIAQTIVVAQP